jgi:hypothetical protein
MAWESAFEDLMTDTVVVASRAASTSPAFSGTHTWSTAASTYQARWVRKPSFVNGPDGQVIEISSVAWVASTGTLHPTDRFTLPDGSAPPVVSIEAYPDDDGLHHTKVMFGR